jgi:acyl-CoA synthetase (AMP-forming)/AMP-acid ligase II
MVVKDIIIESARKYPDKTAVVIEDTMCTFKELDNRSNSLTNALLDMGVGKGDRVAILSDNCLPYVELCCALEKGGIVIVPLNTSLSKQDLAYIINNTEANTLFLGENYIDLLNSIRGEIRGVKNLITIGASSGEMRRYEELVWQYPREDPEVEVDEQDICAVSFSSGTTGLPKGGVATDKRWLTSTLDSISIFHLTHDDIILIPVPLFWMLTIMYAGFQCGCTTVLTRGFDPKTVLETIEREKITASLMPPFYIASFLEYPRLKEYDLSSLGRIVLIGGSMPAEVLKRATEVFGNIFTHTYGNLEGGWLTFLPPEDMILEGPPEKVKRLQSCGRRGRGLLNAELRVVDENDNDILPGQIGEVIARGDGVIKEYWKLPQATAETLRGGYVYTGDMATVDEEGYVYLVGRKKDVIGNGAESVYPTEVEEVLYRHPAILEATVIGIPDVELGEAVKAVVVLKEGQKATEEEITGFCQQYLAGHAVPGSVEFIDQLPRNASGKILKRELKERYSKA